MFRNILVHIPSERPVRPVIDVAVALTVARRSHLDAVAIGYESMGAAGMLVEGGGDAVHDGGRTGATPRKASAAISTFEIEAKLRRDRLRRQVLAAIPAEASATIGASPGSTT